MCEPWLLAMWQQHTSRLTRDTCMPHARPAPTATHHAITTNYACPPGLQTRADASGEMPLVRTSVVLKMCAQDSLTACVACVNGSMRYYLMLWASPVGVHHAIIQGPAPHPPCACNLRSGPTWTHCITVPSRVPRGQSRGVYTSGQSLDRYKSSGLCTTNAAQRVITDNSKPRHGLKPVLSDCQQSSC